MTQGPDGTPRILIATGPDAIARTAADIMVAAIAGAIGERGVAHVALTGGSSARGLYRELRSAARLRAVDWAHVHLWTGDDRVVPLDHDDSNMGLAVRELFGPGGPEVPEAHVHPMLAGVDVTAPDASGWAAARYAADLSAHAPAADDAGTPLFDLLLLGMGPDGHILSVFPDSPALEDGAPGVMGIPAPTHIGPSVPRVTLGPAVVGVAREVLLMVGGAAKAPVVAEVLQGDPEVRRFPARLACIDTATWLLDRDSAADLVAG